LGGLVRKVAVSIRNGVGDFEGGTVALSVGAMNATMEVKEAVTVGAVEVGKGPSSTLDVSASAVRVALAFFPAPISMGEALKATQRVNMDRADTPKACK